MKLLLAIEFVFMLLAFVGNVLNFALCQDETQAQNRISFGYGDSSANQLLDYQQHAGNTDGLHRYSGYTNYAGDFPYPPIGVHNYEGDFFAGAPRTFINGDDLNIGEDYAAQRFDSHDNVYNHQQPVAVHNLPNNIYGIAYASPHNGYGTPYHYALTHSVNYAPMRYTAITHSNNGGVRNGYPAYNRPYATGLSAQNFLGHSLAMNGGLTGTGLAGMPHTTAMYNGHLAGFLPVHNF